MERHGGLSRRPVKVVVKLRECGTETAGRGEGLRHRFDILLEAGEMEERLKVGDGDEESLDLELPKQIVYVRSIINQYNSWHRHTEDHEESLPKPTLRTRSLCEEDPCSKSTAGTGSANTP